MCALTQPGDVPELTDLRGKWMKPQQLIEVMVNFEPLNT